MNSHLWEEYHHNCRESEFTIIQKILLLTERDSNLMLSLEKNDNLWGCSSKEIIAGKPWPKKNHMNTQFLGKYFSGNELNFIQSAKKKFAKQHFQGNFVRYLTTG